jgi:transposase
MQLTSQSHLALIPTQATPIGLAAGLLEGDQGGVVFLHGLATFEWDLGDQAGRRWSALQLVRLKAASGAEVAAGFGVSEVTLWRWRQQQKAAGMSGLSSLRRGPRAASKLKPELVEQIRSRFAQGRPAAALAVELGVSLRSIYRVRRQRGALEAGPSLPSPGLELLAVPAPVVREAERQAARAGLLREAPPVFTEGRELPLAGLLLILPGLAQVGLLEAATEVFGQLRNGFYGLRSLLLTLCFLALLREPRAEGVTRIAPADLGRILGLDRAPEVKTIRRRLGELAERGLGEELVKSLARKHAEADPQALGFLYLDGHVRGYFGTRRLPKAHLARMRISGPATVETWVADDRGDPLFVVLAEPAASMVTELRRLLPELRELVGERRLTICFDRGGWSPELFYDLTQAGFDFLTYRKGRSRPEPARGFRRQSYPDPAGSGFEYELADRRVRLRLPARKGRPKTLKVRQVTRLVGVHQTQILTSRSDLSAAEVAHRMFSRWRQENYFRYARAHFALEALDSYATAEDDLARLVPNPERARLRRRLVRAQASLAEREAALGSAALDNKEAARPTMRGFKIAHSTLARAVRLARLEVAQLEAALKATPSRLPLGELAPDSLLLDKQSKLLTHAVRMSVYNAESILARLLAPHYARADDEARTLLQEVFRAAGDLQLLNGHLEVRLNPLSAPRRTRALAALCSTLNQHQVTFPGTDLELRYSVKQPASLS